MENEIWKTIEDFPDYQISSLGRVKSFKRSEMVIMRQYRQTSKSKGNRRIVWLRSDKLGRASRNVDKLVANAFLENPHGFPDVIHKDGNGENNRLDNLAWNYHRNGYIRQPRAVKIVETGEIYPSQGSACKALLIDPALLSRALNDPKRTAGGFHFVHATKQEVDALGNWL